MSVNIQWSSWFIGFATLFAVLVALKQAKAGEKIALQTRHDAVRTMVLPMSAKLIPDPGNISHPKIMRIELLIRNMGVGPALNLRVSYKISRVSINGELDGEIHDGSVMGRFPLAMKNRVLGVEDQKWVGNQNDLEYELQTTDDYIEGKITYASVFEENKPVVQPFWFVVNAKMAQSISTISVNLGTRPSTP